MGVRKIFAVPIFAAALFVAACTGGSGSQAAAPSAGQLIIALGNGLTAPSPFILTDQQFISPNSNAAYLRTTIDDPHAVWSVSGSTVALASTPPGQLALPGGTVPTASPGATYIQTAQAYGPSTVTVRDGSSSASITVYHFASIAFRCQFRYTPAFNFDPDRISSGNLQQPDTFDVYVTEPTSGGDQLDPCNNTALVTGSTPTWHMPSGGVVIPISNSADFMAITSSQLVNPVTTAPVVQNSVALLLRTHEGRYVKLEPGLGLLEVSDTNGTFPF